MNRPDVGEVWLVDLDPTVGSEQGGRRPCVVVSDRPYNQLPINMAMIVPLTSRLRGLPHQPAVGTGTSGLTKISYARPEDVRAVSIARLRRRLGAVEADELESIKRILRLFLGV